MFSSMAFFVCLVVFYLDRESNKLISVATMVFYIPLGLSYDLIDFLPADIFFEHARPEMGGDFYFIFLIISFSLLFSSLLLTMMKFETRTETPSIYYVNSTRIAILYYTLAFFSFFAFLLNFQRVGFSIENLFVNPRGYEFLFGKYFAINYIYFLNVPALCLSIFFGYLRGRRIRFSLFINLVLLTISLFHGIKFTIFDTFMIPLIFFVILHGAKITFLKVLSAGAFFMLIFFGFSYAVRGGSDSILIHSISYILPNYYNLIYSFEQSWLKSSFLLPLIVPNKIPLPDIFSEYTGSVSGFVLNDSYNMYTGFHDIFMSVGFFGPLIVIPVLFGVFKLFFAKARRSLLHCFMATMMFYGLIFMFFFWPYTKTKYWYLVLIIFLSDAFIRLSFKHKSDSYVPGDAYVSNGMDSIGNPPEK